MAAVSSEIKDDFDAKGYTVWEGFISRSHAQELRDLVLDMAKFEQDAGDCFIPVRLARG